MNPRPGMRLKLISCEVFFREMCSLVSASPHQIDVQFLPKGLHDIGAPGMQSRMQAAIDEVDPEAYEGILMGYGLCNNGLAGMTARRIPIVLPRANDCITLFLGSAKRYVDYFNATPGTYFMTTGWKERGTDTGELSQISIQKQMGMSMTMPELIAKYGEENAKYLYDTLVDTTHNYSQYTYIEMGNPIDADYMEKTKAQADEKGWKFERVAGDMGMLNRLINGPWDTGEFLVIEPGRRVRATYNNETVIDVEDEE